MNKVSPLEVALLIEKCERSKSELNKIKDQTVRMLIDAIISARQSKNVIKELVKIWHHYDRTIIWNLKGTYENIPIRSDITNWKVYEELMK